MDNNNNGNNEEAISSSELYLRNLNKSSVRIAKSNRKPYASSSSAPVGSTFPDPTPVPPGLNSNPSQQPPVYNINKNDFREVVQRLTGAPPNERLPPPPPAVPNRGFSSRLQRIRPPPLAQIGTRPPMMNSGFPRGQNDFGSMLPPLPSVHNAAESPISAYMRILQGSGALSGLGSASSVAGGAPVGPHPEGRVSQQQNEDGVAEETPAAGYMRVLSKSIYAPSSLRQFPQLQLAAPAPAATPAPPVQQQNSQPFPSLLNSPLPFGMQQSSPFPLLPNSPVPFGCSSSQFGMLSPGMLSPGLLLSPSGQFGWLQLPVSPTVPLSSPRWKGL